MGELAVALYVLGTILASGFMKEMLSRPDRTWRDHTSTWLASSIWPVLVIVAVVLHAFKMAANYRRSTTLDKG